MIKSTVVKRQFQICLPQYFGKQLHNSSPVLTSLTRMDSLFDGKLPNYKSSITDIFQGPGTDAKVVNQKNTAGRKRKLTEEVITD